MSFTGTVAIITGGSRGIGRAIVLELIAIDVKVAFTYHNNRQAAEALWKEVQEQGGETMGFQQDVTDFEGAKAVFAAVKERFGRIDMLVNKAGITRDKPLAMMQEEDWRAVIETNLYGTINFSRAAVYAFMKQRSGRIVNITSVSGQTGLLGQTNYSASKAGIIGFTKALEFISIWDILGLQRKEATAMGTLRFVDLQTRPTEVLDWTSLTLDEFRPSVPPFETAFQAHLTTWHLDGQPRTARRYTTYHNCPLPMPEDRLLCILITRDGENAISVVSNHGIRSSL